MQPGKPSISKPNRCGLTALIAAALALVIFAVAENVRAASLLIAADGFGGVLGAMLVFGMIHHVRHRRREREEFTQ